mgnify:CR=1 FL=1
MEKLIYLDNAATTLHKPPQVVEAVKNAILTAGNAARGAHGASMQASRTVFETRQKLARLLGCPQAEHVVFTANSTMALNIAIQGILSPEDHAISTDLEHNSVLRPLYALQEQGMGLDFVRADQQGNIRYEDFAPLFRSNTKAVVCTHASNLTGNMLDIARIAEIAHAHGALLIVDASQTAGTVPIDMTALGVDVLCFTGHKGLMGPQGTGGLCIRPGVEIRPLLRGGSGIHSFDRHQPEAYPTRLEAGTLNSHGIAGLDAAADYLLEVGVENIHQKEQALMRRFYEGVRHIDGIHLNILAAIALYRSRDEAWRQRLIGALNAAAEYHFIRTVSVYGAAVLPLLERLDWSGSARWRKQLMDDVRLQAAYYPRFLEPRLAPGEALTPTELQILHLICADKSNAEIGQIMDIKLPTVKTHVSHILDKLDVRRRSEAKTAAKRLRLIPEER